VIIAFVFSQEGLLQHKSSAYIFVSGNNLVINYSAFVSCNTVSNFLPLAMAICLMDAEGYWG
jgi:hypothetical protein